MRLALLALPALLATTPALADPPVTVTVTASFDDVKFDLENAIIEAGLKVQSVNHLAEMLERTKADVGATRTLFTHADIYNFCSAKVSRQVMEADILNVQFCPYRIFIFTRPESPGEVTVGHMRYPAGVTDAVNDLLDGIIAEALKGY